MIPGSLTRVVVVAGVALATSNLLSTWAIAAVGRTEAAYDVSQNGSAVYTIPIRVTDGINGMTPRLALTYAGPGARTVLGVGFTLAGFSYITPCRKTIAQDLNAAPVTLTSADRYCLDGARLRLVTGTPYGASETTYRTELDQMVRVTAKASTGNVPGWFKVEMPNGLEYEYGNTPNSKLLASATTGAPPQFWAVNRISDSNGNSIVFVYDADNGTRKFRPNYISYTERAGSGSYRITFVYQAATQPQPILAFTPSMTGGAAHSEDKLLDRIDLSHEGAVYRKIVLAYESGAGNNKRLSSVQECVPGAPDDCLPPTVLAWQSATAGHGPPIIGSVASTGIPLDVNGDGFQDLVWATSGTWRYMLGGATGYGAAINTSVAATNPTKALPLEWNGDGFADLLIDWYDAKWRVLRGSTSGFLTSVVHAGPGTGISSSSATSMVADVNGDGRDDLLRMNLNTTLAIYARINGATGFGAESLHYTTALMRTLSKGFIPIDGASATHRPDFNGDGRIDLLIYGCEWEPEPPGFCYATGWYQFISNGTSFSNEGMLTYATLMADPRFGDVNADGLTDAVYPAQTPGKWYIGYGQGSGGLSIKAGPSFAGYTNYKILTGDYNGDGYDDLYAATSSSQVWDVFQGSSNGLAAAIATGISSTGYWKLTDVTGDGMADLGRTDSTTLVWSLYPRSGLPGERLLSATDGLGNSVSFSYLPMTDAAVYSKASGAVYPNRDYQGSAPLVRTMQVSPAGGASFTLTYKYFDARLHSQGRAFLGMGKREITDSRAGPFIVETYRQDFPFIGASATTTLKQSVTGNVIQSATHSYISHTLNSTAGNERYLPYRSQTINTAYELGGIKNGLPISEITETRSVNTYGNPTFVAIDTKDTDSASPEFNSIYRTEVTSAFTENETDWCIGVPTSRSEKRILPAGGFASEMRTASWQVATAQCRVTQETIEPGAGSSLSLVTDVGYDSCGNVNSASSYPAGTSGQQRTTSINHGMRCQRPESITNPENHTSTRAYDWPLALPTGLTDPNGMSTTLDFDGFGRLKQRNNPDGTDAVISLTTCTSSNGWCGKDPTVRLKISQATRDTSNATIRTDEQYQDGFGRVRWVHSDSLESGPAMVQTAFDAFGRPSAQSQPYFQGGTIYSTVYTRDLIGRVTQANAPISEGQTSGRITGFAYEGRDLKVTDPKGNTTTRRSNVIGQLRAVVDPSPGGTTSYAYEPFGELESITDAAALPNITSWTYNLRGFAIGTTDPDSGSWSYVPNAFGEMTSQTDAKSQVANFTYDKLSRPLTRSEFEGTTTWTWGTSAASKNIGRLASITSPGSYEEIFTYDSLGRPSQQQVNADSGSYYVNLTYASTTGLLNTLEYPTSTSGYRLKLGYEYTNGLLKRVKDANGTTIFWEAISTDAWGHIQDEAFGNGVQTFTDFDQASGLMQSREGEKGATQLIHAQVNWDLNGNLIQRKDLKLSPNVTEDFYYDTLNRFDYSTRTVGTGSPSTNADVTLDAIGNINWKLGVGNYSYHATKKRAVVTAGSYSFGYDANGNMTSRNGASIGYTSFNLPNVINAPGGYSSTLSYGAFRNRFKQVAIGPQGTETTIYVAGLLEKVTNGSGTHYRHYIQGGKGTAAIHSRTVGGSNVTHYLHRDHLGSPELITDAGGNVLVRPSFSAYGERRDGSDWDGAIGSADLGILAGISRRGFTGHEHLDAVNLIHMNGRVYEPIAGRFLSKDPIVHLGLSQSPNSYSYVWNNPLSIIDLSGFDPECGGGEFVGACEIVVRGDGGGGGITDPDLIREILSWLGRGGSGGGSGDGGFVPDGGGGGSGDGSTSNGESEPQELEPGMCPSVPLAPPGVDIAINIEISEDHTWLNPGSFYAFYEAVRNGGVWDYKQVGKVLGQPSPYEDFGNFNFGATGPALGVPEQILLRGAGAASILAGTSPPNSSNPLWKPPYGDSPIDQQWIKRGIEYYKCTAGESE